MPSSLRTRKVPTFEFARSGGFLAGSPPLVGACLDLSYGASNSIKISSWWIVCQSIFLLCRLLRLTSVVAIWLRNWIFLGRLCPMLLLLLRKDGFD
jgi:hypothetical protein